jgi:hypothetical protein
MHVCSERLRAAIVLLRDEERSNDRAFPAQRTCVVPVRPGTPSRECLTNPPPALADFGDAVLAPNLVVEEIRRGYECRRRSKAHSALAE